MIKVMPIPGTKFYEVLEDYNDYDTFIEKGFRFDGATIPPWAWRKTYTPYHPDVLESAAVHDKRCANSKNKKERRHDDWLFRKMLIEVGKVPKKTAQLMYVGVTVATTFTRI